MQFRRDGSVQSGNVPTFRNTFEKQDNRVFRGMVIKTTFLGVDNFTTNDKNPRVLYDVVILGGFESGQVLTDCRMMTDLGGNGNFHEVVLTPSSKVLKDIPMVDHDGDVVFVAFNQGNVNYPIIIGMDLGYDTKDSIGATEEDGIREIRQFNGVKFEINKNGELRETRQGGSVVEGRFKPGSGVPQYKREVLDGEKVTEVFKSGLTIVKDGVNDSVTVITKTGASLEINGKTDKITLSGGFLDLGKQVSDFVVMFDALKVIYDMHTHPILPSDPLLAIAPVIPLPPSVASQTVKIQP